VAAGVGYTDDFGMRKYFLLVATRDAQSSQQADLAGSWHSYRIASNPAPLGEGCGYGTVELDELGAIVSGSKTECGGQSEEYTNVELALDADGVVTGQAGSTDGSYDIEQGSLTSTSTEMVMVERNMTDDSYSLILMMWR
jgi:hypothetical protein